MSIAHQPCTIKYDRGKKGVREKAFVVHNGLEVARVPAKGCKDYDAKETASLIALEHDRPDIAEWISDRIQEYLLHPEAQAIKLRAIRAGFAVRDGLVNLNPPVYLPDVAQVVSQTGSGEIHSIWEDGYDALACSCQDWANGKRRSWVREDHPGRPKSGAPEIYPDQFDCKHITAFRMALQMQNQLSRDTTNYTF